MKKTLLAAALAATMLSGCAQLEKIGISFDDQTPAELNAKAQEVAAQEYTASHLTSVEQVRLAVNSIFKEATPIYADYAKHIATNKAGGQVATALSMQDSDEEREKYLADLKKNKPADYDAYIALINDKHMTSIYKRSLKMGLEIAEQTLVFKEIDQTSLLTEIEFSKLAAEKDNLALTAEQISILNDTVYSLYQEYQRNKAAGLLK